MVLQRQLSWILGKHPKILIIFVIGLIRTSRQFFTNHVALSQLHRKHYLTLQQMSDTSLCKWLKCIHHGYAEDFSTNGLTCHKVLEWNPLCIFNICWQKKLIKQWAISLSELILCGITVWLYSQHRKQFFQFHDAIYEWKIFGAWRFWCPRNQMMHR